MAKVFTNLYSRLTSFENLYLAYLNAARGKRGHPDVAEFDYRFEANLFDLQDELQNKTYSPGGYYSFYIRDPKRRLVSAAPFRDRVVHHALCQIIEPIFERTFIPDSYANRVGKGTHAALDRAQDFARRYPYVLQCDVKQFFPSVDHPTLRRSLLRKIADPDVIGLCDRILESGAGVLADEYTPVWFPGDDLFSINRRRGLPIGNLTSQFWANVLLNELDQFVKRGLQCAAYLRYVDDFLLFAGDKRLLWDWRQAIIRFLIDLRLTLHETRSTIYPTVTGIPFLGFRLYPTHRRLKRRNGVAFARRLRHSLRLYRCGRLALAEVHARVQGWVAHAAHGDTWGLRRALLARATIRST
ncbi:MAG: RNA-dependent DNA polymerase [Verrucomicrobia bacterium]|nr:RNA-dependent DNA polymerase [Verrucomicrobiota bacterium]